MNEPLVMVSTTVRPVGDLGYRTFTAVDRLGYRSVFTSQIPILESSGNASVGPTGDVLLVEDSDDDAMLFARAARKSHPDLVVRRATNGSQARALLDAFLPSLVVLDCHLLGESGLDVLRALRNEEATRPVPVIMLSGTSSPQDVEAAYALGVNSFLQKPATCEAYLERVTQLLNYWIGENLTTLPQVRSCPCLKIL